MKKYILTIILIFVAVFASVQTVYADSEPEGCIAFTSDMPFYINLGDSAGRNPWDGTVQVSTNGTDWDEYTTGNIIDPYRYGDKYSVFFRGRDNTWLGNTSFKVQKTDSISCSGNIENLLDYTVVQDGQHPVMSDNAFAYLFENCNFLTEAPDLSATTLASRCCGHMFHGCTSLTKAPELPATTLAYGCYEYMFYGCESLTEAPALPATTLTAHCYEGMFRDCTSLTEAPELPATTLAGCCYWHMFDGCTSLTRPPVLPATTLPSDCYSNMFNSSGVKISSEKGIFDGVSYAIPYRIPEMGEGTYDRNSLSDMFTDTKGPFTGTPEINTTYYLAVPDWGGSGTEENPYVISDDKGWNTLAKMVKLGYSMEGLFFRLGDNIEVTDMVGTYDKPFSGSFDGDGYTLTFNAKEAPKFCAPFVYVKDASFKNLHIAGTIITNQKFAAGLICRFDGTVTVTNCRSSIIIDSSVNGDGTHGGFIAVGENNGAACFKGCSFDGKLLGPATIKCGGFVGWANPTDKTYTVEGCLFAPEELTIRSDMFNFIRTASAAATIQNSYYTKNIGGNSQGKAVRTVTADEGIAVGSEKKAEYNVSGITAHETGLAFGNAFYAGKDDKITVTIPSACDEIVANAGTLTGEGTAYTLTMPDENVTLTMNKGANHKWKAATCTQPKTCSVCHTTEGEALGHAWGAWTVLDEKQHQRICENDSTHIEKEDHKWDDGAVTKEPTTAETGEKTFTCTVCKTTRTEIIPKIDDAPVDDRIPVVSTAKIHTKGNFTKKQMKIIFPAKKKVDKYRIQYRMAGKTKWKSDWSTGVDTYVINGVKKYGLYEFRIAGFVKQADGSWARGKWSKTAYRYMSAVPLKRAIAGKKSITVTWKADSKANGYQIQYSLKKSMAKSKTITVNGKAKTKYTIKKLKKGKKYYVRVRPFRKRSGKKYLGILTGIKAARVK